MVNGSILAEMRADALEMVADFGREIIFLKARGETTPTSWQIAGMISDPMLQTDLETGGITQAASFEIRIRSDATTPATWADVEAWAKQGRQVQITGTPGLFRIRAINLKEGSAWVGFRVESIDPAS